MHDHLPGHVCDSAARVLDLLAIDLLPDTSTERHEPTGVHMPLFVERRLDCPSGSLFLVAHYHPSSSARVPDPAVVMLRSSTGDYVPLSFETAFARIVTAEARDTVRVILPVEHAKLLRLVNVWMVNVEANLLRADQSDIFETEEVCSRVA